MTVKRFYGIGTPKIWKQQLISCFVNPSMEILDDYCYTLLEIIKIFPPRPALSYQMFGLIKTLSALLHQLKFICENNPRFSCLYDLSVANSKLEKNVPIHRCFSSPILMSLCWRH